MWESLCGASWCEELQAQHEIVPPQNKTVAQNTSIFSILRKTHFQMAGSMIRIRNGYRDQLPQNLVSLSEDSRYQDTMLVCQDGILRSSRFVLALSLPQLRRPLRGREEEEELVIVMPSFQINAIKDAMIKVFEATGITYHKSEVKAQPFFDGEVTIAKSASKKEVDFETKGEEVLQIKNEVDSEIYLDPHGCEGWQILNNTHHKSNLEAENFSKNKDVTSEDEYQGKNNDYDDYNEDEDWENKTNKGRASKIQKNSPNRKRQEMKDNADIKWDCHICDEPFATKADYKDHEADIHVREGMIVCPYENCDKKYKATETRYGQSRLIVRHIERHKEKERTKEYVCSECGKTFKNKRSLLPHMQIHRGIKNVPCDKCGQMFCSKSFLWSHKMQSKCGAEEVVCPTCGKKCSNKYYLKRHLLQHTAERQFKCPFEGCGKSFFDQHVMKSHEKIHLDIKDYQCPICPKQFRQGQQLKVHVKRHQGVSP